MDSLQRAQRIPIRMTTESDGSGTFYSDQKVNGRILQLQYVKTDFADGSTMTITGESSGLPILAESAINASAVRAPRQPTHSTAGAASLYAVGGEPVEDYIYVVDERLKCVVASGGNAKTGVWWVYVG